MLTVRRLFVVGAVATTAAFVGIVVPNAAANGTVAFPGEIIDQGTLTIETTPSSVSVVWYDADGSVKDSSTATLRKNDKCLINATKVADLSALLSIRPTDSGGATLPLGYVSNGLGTRENDTCSTANGTFGAAESIELALGTDLLSEGIVIDRARLDLEGKFGTSLQYTRFADVADDEGTSGSVDDLWTASDNGSDNGPNDNSDVWIGTEGDASDDFQKLSITPTSADNRGQISLEAGGDYGAAAPLHRTTFWLIQQNGYEYALDCGDTESEEAGVDEDFAVTTFPDVDELASYPISATLARYDDDAAPTGEDCAPIGANLSSSNLNVLLRKTTVDENDVEQDPRLRLELVWAVPAGLVGGSDDPFARFVDLDGIVGPDTDVFPREAAQFCSSYSPEASDSPDLDPDDDGLDGLVDVDHAGTVLHPADPRFTNGLLSWCVISDERVPGKLEVLVGGEPEIIDVIFQRVVWDGQGDPYFF
jgi:hypothetical protein